MLFNRVNGKCQFIIVFLFAGFVCGTWAFAEAGKKPSAEVKSEYTFPAFSDSLDRGHSILLEKGFQIQGLCSPQIWGGGYPPVPPVQVPDMASFVESNFTGMSLLGNAYCNLYFGAMPDIQWGRWADLSSSLRAEELPYLPTMVGFQYDDEEDVNSPDTLEDAKSWFAITQANYPSVITFANQYGGQNTLEELQYFVAYCKPDMVCHDTYPFQYPRPWLDFSSYTAPRYYSQLGIYRTLGLGGHDGTGTRPIPYGQYLQTYIRQGTTPTESEMRMNMFSSLTFGYKYLQAFCYTTQWPMESTQSILFSGLDDQSPTTRFYEMAEINREARNLGKTLVRLLSTDVGVKKGTHSISGGTAENNVPTKVWTADDPNNDPYITNINSVFIDNPQTRGDLFIGYFKPLVESDDGNDYEDEIYFMVFNGQCWRDDGDSYQTRHAIRLDFDFGDSGINSLQRLSRETGEVEDVPLTHDGGSLYHLDFVLPGGTADLFKFNTGALFIRNAELNCGFGADLSGIEKYSTAYHALTKRQQQIKDTTNKLLANFALRQARACLEDAKENIRNGYFSKALQALRTVKSQAKSISFDKLPHRKKIQNGLAAGLETDDLIIIHNSDMAVALDRKTFDLRGVEAYRKKST